MTIEQTISKAIEGVECQYCHTVFHDYRSDERRFCSPECWASFNRKPKPKCLICTQEVRTQYNRLCSVTCSNLWKYANKANHPNWRGGATTEYRKLRNSMWSELENWRRKVIARDRKCVLCGSIDKLEADHIKAFITYPELRCDVSNGRTLCQGCHRKTDNYGSKARFIDHLAEGGKAETFFERLT